MQYYEDEYYEDEYYSDEDEYYEEEELEDEDIPPKRQRNRNRPGSSSSSKRGKADKKTRTNLGDRRVSNLQGESDSVPRVSCDVRLMILYRARASAPGWLRECRRQSQAEVSCRDKIQQTCA